MVTLRCVAHAGVGDGVGGALGHCLQLHTQSAGGTFLGGGGN